MAELRVDYSSVIVAATKEILEVCKKYDVGFGLEDDINGMEIFIAIYGPTGYMTLEDAVAKAKEELNNA
jgi:hypothetical protein